MTQSDRINGLAKEFVMSLGAGTESYAELMVALESVLMGAMMLNTDLHNCRPETAVALCESAMQAAIERFLADRQKRR